MKNISLTAASFLLLPFLAACDKTAEAPEPAPAAAPAAAPEAPAAPINSGSALLAPEKATEKAPETFRAKFSTTKGDIVVEVTRSWAPNGADRFYNLIKTGFYDGVIFFRVVDGFMAQTGIHGDPAVSAKWRDARIMDDPYNPAVSNKRGFVTYAMAGPNTRTSQIFFNFRDNGMLDQRGFPPFGRVVEGEQVLDQLYRGYGDAPPDGRGPDQGRIQYQGNSYLKAEFPNLDSIKTARLLP